MFDRQTQIAALARLWLPEKKTGVWGIDFPDFPGCVTSGRTELEAIDNAHEALTLHLEGMVEDGEDIPSTTSGGQARKMQDADRKKGDVWIATYIIVSKPQRQIRFNIMASAAELAQIDRAAKIARKNRSRFLVETVLDMTSKS